MYPHTPENNSGDTVQLLVPEFDPVIDGDNQPVSTNSNQPQHPNNNTTDVNHTQREDTQVQKQHSDTDWPDAPTVQIPWVSSTVSDHPPEVHYIRKASAKLTNKEDIPNIEEDEQDNHNTEYITSLHNTTPFKKAKG